MTVFLLEHVCVCVCVQGVSLDVLVSWLVELQVFLYSFL